MSATHLRPKWPSLPAQRSTRAFRLDKSILGGTVVRIGSTVYDGSVKGRLERLREALTDEVHSS